MPKFQYKGINIQHRYEDVPFIVAAIESVKPSLVVELGCGNGGLSYLFADAVAKWSGLVVGYDCRRLKAMDEVVLDCSNFEFREEDIINDVNKDLAEMLEAEEGPIFLYCDNGFKELEMLMYGAHLREGDLMGCHDWVTEVRPEIAERISELLDLEPYMWQTFESLAHEEFYPISMTRLWKKGPNRSINLQEFNDLEKELRADIRFQKMLESASKPTEDNDE